MKLPLLEQSQQIPDRVPMRTGYGTSLASSRDLAVDTSALPRQLPQANGMLEADYGQAPLQALARLGATGNTAASNIATMLVEASVRKQDANDAAEVEGRYGMLARGADNAITELETSTTHETFKPSFEDRYRQLAAAAFEGTTPRQQALLATKAQGLRTSLNREVNNISQRKFLAYQNGVYDAKIDTSVELASNAATEQERKHHITDLEAFFVGQAAEGLKLPDTIYKDRRKALNDINYNVAKTDAFEKPLETLDRLDKGQYDDTLRKDQRLSLYEGAESRLRTLRADANALEAREKAQLKDQQATAANDARAIIIRNFALGGPGLDLSMDLTNKRRDYGEHYDELLTMNRLYLDRQQNPKPSKGDPILTGKIETEYRTGQFDNYTNKHLQILLENDQLNLPQFQHLTAIRDSEMQQRKRDAETLTDAQKQAKKDREEMIRTGQNTIHSFIVLKGPFSDPDISNTIANESVAEFQRRTNDPNADVNEELSQVIGRATIRMQMAGQQKTYPYTNEDEVKDALAARLIDGNTAKIYYRIFQFQRQYGKPKTTTTTTEPKKPGLLQRFGIGSEPESPTPAQRKP